MSVLLMTCQLESSKIDYKLVQFNRRRHFYKNNPEELLQESDTYSLKQLKSLVHGE